VFDVLHRHLLSKGYKVNFAQNFTDIDDKIIKRANEEGVPMTAITEKYIAEFKTDAHGLNVQKPCHAPMATENIGHIISFIGTLVDKGFAYKADNGDVYFDTGSFEGYGKLCGQPLEDLEVGARIEVNEQKKSPVDFALWKAAKTGEPSYSSPFSDGRPGWHIECSAMIEAIFGDTIDIHCGGKDLVFPHHENEIAQSEAATGRPLSKYFMHNAYLNIDGRKMSKSLGNFSTVRDISDRYGYEPVRYLMLSAHYRSPLNFSDEIIEQCVSALERLYNCKQNLEFAIERAEDAAKRDAEDALKRDVEDAVKRDVEDAVKRDVEDAVPYSKFMVDFTDALDDDLNTADALSVMFMLAKEINVAITNNTDKSSLQKAHDTLMQMADILGMLYRSDDTVPQEILDLIEERKQAKLDKHWSRADEIREQIKALGWEIKDTKDGQQAGLVSAHK
jgi:cysteinyl-tRNA synthetase